MPSTKLALKYKKKNEYVALCSKEGEIQETKTCISNNLFNDGDDIFHTKPLNLADVSSFSPCMTS